MERQAVFAGSFDPFTVAHFSIAKHAAALFDRVTILVAHNVRKTSWLSAETRVSLAQKAVAKIPNISVESFDGLTTDYMKRAGAKFLVRGVRSPAEFDAERNLAWNNQLLFPEAETVFLLLEPELSAVSSSAVREICSFGGNALAMIPTQIHSDFLSELEKLHVRT